VRASERERGRESEKASERERQREKYCVCVLAQSVFRSGVASISRIDQIIGLFDTRTL